MRTRTRTAHGAALLYVLSAAAASACPVAADLATGIRIDFDNGGHWIAQDMEGGAVEARFRWDPTYSEQVLSLHDGIYVTHLAIPDLEVEIAFTHTPAVAMAPPPVPGAHWFTRVTADSESGPRLEAVDHTWGAEGTIEIGDCTYATLRMLHEQGDTPPRVLTDYILLTELGVLFYGAQRTGDAVILTLTPTAIAALP